MSSWSSLEKVDVDVLSVESELSKIDEEEDADKPLSEEFFVSEQTFKSWKPLPSFSYLINQIDQIDSPSLSPTV